METKRISFTISNETKILEKNGEEIFTFEGYASTSELDRTNDIVAKGAFKNTIERHKSQNNRPIRMKYQHSMMDLIGGFPIEFVEETDRGLKVIGEICLGVQRGREAMSLIKAGFLNNLSIGFNVVDFIMDGKSRIIKELELWEVSVVDEPMNPGSEIVSFKNLQSILDGGLGELNLSQADKEKVKSHLTRYYTKMEKQPKLQNSSDRITVPEIKTALGNIRLAERMLKSTNVFSGETCKYLGKLLHLAYKSNADKLEELEDEKELHDPDMHGDENEPDMHEEHMQDGDMKPKRSKRDLTPKEEEGLDEDEALQENCYGEDMDGKSDVNLTDEENQELEDQKFCEQLERVLRAARKLL